MTIAIAQVTSASIWSGATASKTFSSACTNPSTILCGVSGEDFGGSFNVSDPSNGSYVKKATGNTGVSGSSGEGNSNWYEHKNTATTALTITATPVGTATGVIILVELTGTNTSGSTAVNAGNGGGGLAAVASFSITTTKDNCAIFVFCTRRFNNSSSHDATYTTLFNTLNPNNSYHDAEYNLDVGTAGAKSGNFGDATVQNAYSIAAVAIEPVPTTVTGTGAGVSDSASASTGSAAGSAAATGSAPSDNATASSGSAVGGAAATGTGASDSSSASTGTASGGATGAGVTDTATVSTVVATGFATVTFANPLYTGQGSIFDLGNFVGTPQAGDIARYSTANGLVVLPDGSIRCNTNTGNYPYYYTPVATGIETGPFAIIINNTAYAPGVGVSDTATAASGSASGGGTSNNAVGAGVTDSAIAATGTAGTDALATGAGASATANASVGSANSLIAGRDANFVEVFLVDTDEEEAMVFDWTNVLGTDTLVSVAYDVPDGLIVEDDTINIAQKKTGLRLSGFKHGSTYVLAATITGQAGKKPTKRLTIRCFNS